METKLDLWSQEQRRLQVTPEEKHTFSLKTPVRLLDNLIGDLHKTPIFLYGGSSPLLAKFIYDNFDAEDGEKFWDNDPNGFVDPGTRCRLIVFDECFNSQDDTRQFMDYLRNGPDMCFGIYLSRSEQPTMSLMAQCEIGIHAGRYGSNHRNHYIHCDVVKHRNAPQSSMFRLNFGIEFPIVGGVVAHAQGKLFQMDNSPIDMQLAQRGRGKRLRETMSDAQRRSSEAQRRMAQAVKADRPTAVQATFNHPIPSDLLAEMKVEFIQPASKLSGAAQAGISPALLQQAGRANRSSQECPLTDTATDTPNKPFQKPWASAPKPLNDASRSIELAIEYRHYVRNLVDDFPPPSVASFINDIESNIVANTIGGIGPHDVKRKACTLSLDEFMKDYNIRHGFERFLAAHIGDNRARRQYEWFVNCLFNMEGEIATSSQIAYVEKINRRFNPQDGAGVEPRRFLETYIRDSQRNNTEVPGLFLRYFEPFAITEDTQQVA